MMLFSLKTFTILEIAIHERNNNKLIVEMVSLTGLQSVIYLLYIFSIGYSTGILQYRCEPGEINKVNIIIERKVNNLTDFNITDDTGCTNADNNSYISLTACQVNTDITVTFTKPENDSLLKKQDVNSYILNCQRDDKPVTKNVSAAIIVQPPSASPQSSITFQRTEWIPHLTMRISKSDVVIGDPVDLIIESDGDTNSTFSAMKCTASSTSLAYTHVLWESDDCKLVDSDLFLNINWTRGTKKISHSFEAFRFKDNHNVQITCTVKICPPGKESLCSLACTTPSTSKRKRRATQSETTKVLKTTFRVADSVQNKGGDLNTNSGTCTGSFLATSAISSVVLFYTVLL